MRKWILIALMTSATSAHAQRIDLKSLDKYFNLAKGVTQLNLDESMIKSASDALNEKKGEEAAAKKAASSPFFSLSASLADLIIDSSRFN